MSFALYIINDTPRVHSAIAPSAAPVPCPPYQRDRGVCFAST